MKQHKNILFITTISGFMQKFLMNDVKLLQSKGWQVHYASNFDNPIYECSVEELRKNGVVCHNIPIKKSPLKLGPNMKSLCAVLRIIKHAHIKAIHCNNPVGGVVGRMAGALSDRHPYVIYTAHGFHFYHKANALNWMLFYPVEKFMAHYTNQIITINQEDRTRAESFRLRAGGQVTQIRGVGYDPNRFHVDSQMRERKRKELGIPEDTLFFLSVGELNKNKNHATVIRAMAKLNNSKIRYGICGEGPGHEALNELIEQLHMQDRVKLYGYQTGIEEYLNAADCFVFPSVREGLGMAAIEAMACKLPLIVADNRGTREYARDNAIVCDPMNVDEYAKAIRRVYKHREQRERMALASEQYAKAFTSENTVHIMNQVYDIMEQEIC